ncbi:hypothetical protein [Oceanobacillus rekensis]|nr:hypothetical protein [Oceanobacillus rekensis]
MVQTGGCSEGLIGIPGLKLIAVTALIKKASRDWKSIRRYLT